MSDAVPAFKKEVAGQKNKVKTGKINSKQELVHLIGPQQSTILALSLLTALASALWLPQAWLVAFVFSSLIENDANFEIIIGAAIGFFAIGAVRAALAAFAEYQLAHAADRIIGELRSQILAREQQVSPYDPAAASSASIAALLIDKLSILSPYISRYTPAILRIGIVSALILVAAFSMSWAVGLILIVSGPLIPLFMALIGVAAQDASEKQMDEISSMNGLLMERLNALIDVRLLHANEKIAEQFRIGAERLRRQTMSVLKIAFLSSTILELFSALGVAMVAVYVGFALLGEIPFGAYTTPLSPIEGIFLLLLAPEFFRPLRDMAAAWHDRVGASAVARDIAILRDRDAQIMLKPGTLTQPSTAKGHIAWTGLRFKGPPLFSVPDGEVAPGEAVAVTGISGIGKSTLIAALGGLVIPVDGQIRVNGVALGPDTIRSARNDMAWMPQEARFFAGSVEHNLTLGEADPARLQEALQLSSAKQLVARLPQGLETTLAENGAGVSGGEARRLMLARAALRNPRIFLADEPTADLDDETAEQVVVGLLKLRAAGATLIAATHDPRLVAALDREIKL